MTNSDITQATYAYFTLSSKGLWSVLFDKVEATLEAATTSATGGSQQSFLGMGIGTSTEYYD